MIIREMNVGEITPYNNNPRHNDEAVAVVAESIQRFGFKVPIVIDKDGVIVTGHTRLKAAKKLGMETVPCITADDLTDEQIKAFRLADNKTAEYATWDFDKLEAELAELKLLGIDMGAFEFELPDKLPDEDEFDLEEALEEIDEPITTPGTIWKLGRHRLMCGDSTKAEEVKKLMDGQQADIVITDPPYNVNYQNVTTDMKIMNDSMEGAKFRAFLLDSFKCMFDGLKEGSPIYVFHADTEGYNFRGSFVEAGFKLSQNLVWVKNSLVPGRSDYQWRHEPVLYGWKPGAAHKWYGDRTNTTVMEDLKSLNPNSMKKAELVAYIKELQEKDYAGSSVIKADKPTFNDDHPTMKPVKLIGKLLFNSSAKGDLVVDSFGGSGSTLIAAEQAGRTCYTMELDPKYADVIVARWEKLTGEKAERYGQV